MVKHSTKKLTIVNTKYLVVMSVIMTVTFLNITLARLLAVIYGGDASLVSERTCNPVSSHNMLLDLPHVHKNFSYNVYCINQILLMAPPIAALVIVLRQLEPFFKYPSGRGSRWNRRS